ncbi:C40 family peptidase [Actinomycetospora sp. C-140]
MTAAVSTPGVVRSPQQMTAVLGVAVGAVGAAVVGTHAGELALPDVGATTAELNLAASSTTHSGAAAVAPVAADATTASATVPELTKAAQRQQAAQAHDQKIEGAIDRFESRIGTTRYEGYCERAVENAFGTQGHYGSAIQDWHSQDQHSDWQHAPRGAMVFYNTSSNGHVALSLGDGRVVSSSAHGRVGIVPIDHFQHPLGWAYAPY